MNPLKKIVIVGGGTAGWIAAAILACTRKQEHCQIELIESDEIGTIGVGESTIPPFLELLNKLGINQVDFIRHTQASFKLGIEFIDWKQKGEKYFHHFGTLGPTGMSDHDFYQLWLKSKKKGSPFGLQDFSICNVMAKHRRFFPPDQGENTPLQHARYALHLDAKLVANYLRKYAEARGVVRTEGMVTDVKQKADGSIEKVILKSGAEVAADFFIDCSGFKALLIGKTLGVGYHDWSNYLLCDRAIAVQTENTGETVPFTRATAREHGWTWRIPLQSRTGNGYVYSSKFCSDEEAKETLLKVVDGKLLTEPRVIPFSSGVRHEIWSKNCLSIGLASGFIEPLESTAIHLVVRGMMFFLRFFPDMECNQPLIDEYNRRMIFEYEEIRDFIVLHYCLTEREDTPFWKQCKTMELPSSLKKAIELYKCQGDLPQGTDLLFQDASWWAVSEGMGVRPAKYNSLADDFDYENTAAMFSSYVNKMDDFVQKLPSHDQFLKDNCPAINAGSEK